jgi:hypothetical protein
MVDVDPRLINEINTAEKGKKIRAILKLNDDMNNKLTREGTSNLAEELISEVESLTGERPVLIKYHPLLGVLSVEGSPLSIKKLIEHPAVDSATISNEDFF